MVTLSPLQLLKQTAMLALFCQVSCAAVSNQNQSTVFAFPTIPSLVTYGNPKDTGYSMVAVMGATNRYDGYGGFFVSTNTVVSTNTSTRIYSGVTGYSWERVSYFASVSSGPAVPPIWTTNNGYIEPVAATNAVVIHNNLTVEGIITNLGIQAFSIVSADNNGAMLSITNGAEGTVLTSNGTNYPTFQTLMVTNTPGFTNIALLPRINPTDRFYPYRSDSETFSDGVLYHRANDAVANGGYTLLGNTNVLPSFGGYNQTLGVFAPAGTMAFNLDVVQSGLVYPAFWYFVQTNGPSREAFYLQSINAGTLGGNSRLLYAENLTVTTNSDSTIDSPVANTFGNIGVYGLSSPNASQNQQTMGVFGRSDGTGGTKSWNVGVGATVDTPAASSTNAALHALIKGVNGVHAVGLFESKTSSDSSKVALDTSSVIVLDSRTTGDPLITARTNNGTAVWTLQSDGSQLFGPGTTNVLYRSGQNLVYTNGGTSALLYMVRGDGVVVGFGVDTTGSAFMQADAGRVVRLGITNSGNIFWDGIHLEPNTSDAYDLGAIDTSGAKWRRAVVGTYYVHNTDDGAGNSSRLKISIVSNVATITGESAGTGANVTIKTVYDAANNIFDAVGAGSPEGAVTAGIGSTYRRSNGGAGTSFYVKESGTGNTGWVGK
jgi:hypothetical protein